MQSQTTKLGGEDRAVGVNAKPLASVLTLALRISYIFQGFSPSFTDHKQPGHTSELVTFLLLSIVQCFKWKDLSKGHSRWSLNIGEIGRNENLAG